MEELVQELQQTGLSREQVKEILTIICKWTNSNYPVMGTLVENILRKNHLIMYPV